MPRIALDLNKAEERAKVKGQWRMAPGWFLGKATRGWWLSWPEVPLGFPTTTTLVGRCGTISATAYPLALPLLGIASPWKYPQKSTESIFRACVSGSRPMWTITARYGLTARSTVPSGVVVGINAQQRVEVSGSASAGDKHVIACLVGNGPLAEPRGGIWMRYATLAFESPG